MSSPGPGPATAGSNAPFAFFAEVEAAFETARHRHGVREHRFRLAGIDLGLRCAGDALVATLTRALAHLPPPPEPRVDFTILAWDAATTGVPLPPPPWSIDAYGVRSEIAGFNDEAMHTGYQADTGTLLLFDAARALALYCTHEASALPSYERAAPLRPILHWCLRRRGLQMVHGGAVGTERGAILLAGDGGRGKSTTALSCLGSRLRYLADDYCLLDPDPPPCVHSVYSSAKVHRTALECLPALLPLVDNPDAAADEKSILLLHEHLPQALLAAAPLRAIALPQVSGGHETSLVRATAADALLALAPSTHVQLPNAGAEVLRGLARLVRQLPAFHLRLGNDVRQIPLVLERLLAV